MAPSYAVPSEEVKQATSGDPGSVQRVRSIDLQLRLKEKEKPQAPVFLSEVIEALKNQRHAVATLMPATRSILPTPQQSSNTMGSSIAVMSPMPVIWHIC